MTPTNKSIETLKTQVDQVTIDLNDLKTETSEDIRKTKAETLEKNTETTKETINKKIEELKILGEEKNKSDISKLEAMLVGLKTVNENLSVLKADITKPLSKNRNSEKTPIEGDKNWIKKQWDGVTDKKEWKENTLTNIARVAGGIGAVALAWKGLKWMFGGDKNKEDNDEEDKEKKSEKKEKKNRRKKILLWTGIGTGGTLIRHNWDSIKLLFTSNKNPKEKFQKDFTTEEKEKVEKFRKDIQKTIEETNASEYDFKDQRGEIKFDISKEPDYKIQSRGQETTIGFDIQQGKYKIADLDIRFTDLKELVRVANMTNRFLRKYGGKKTFWNTRGMTNNFIYRQDLLEGDGIYYSGYIKNTFRILKKSTIEKYCKGRKKNHMESYVEYLNKVTK